MTLLSITFTASQIITMISAIVISLSGAVAVLYKQFVNTVNKSEKDCEQRMIQYSNSFTEMVSRTEKNFMERYDEYKDITEQRFATFKEVTEDKIDILQKSLDETRKDREKDHEEVKEWKDNDKKKVFQVLKELSNKIENIDRKVNTTNQ